MLDPSIQLYLDTIESPKVKYYLRNYVLDIHRRMGKVCDIFVAELSTNRPDGSDNEILMFVLNLIVKPTTAFVCRTKEQSIGIELSPDITEVVYLDPRSFPQTQSTDYETIVDEIRQSVENILRRTDHETILDNHEINCMCFIDPFSFQGQLYF